MTATTHGRIPAEAATAVPRRLERWVFAATLLVALALRLRDAARTPFWFDELFTLWMARHPLPEMLRLLAGDVHPPLPTLLVAGWRALGGDGTLWLKLLPITIGLLAVVATRGFARALFGARAGLLAALLLALHPMHVYFSQEMRSYGLLTLALVLAAWTAWRWVASGRTRDAVPWVLAAGLSLHTHYLAFVVLGMLDLWVLARLARAPRRLLPWAVAHLGVLVLLLPLAGMHPAQLALARDSWVTQPSWADLVSLARKIMLGALYLIPPLGALAAMPLLRREQRASAALAWWMGLAPILVTLAATLAGAHLFTERYMFFTLPYWCCLFAAGASGIRRPTLAAATSLLVVAFAARATWLWHALPEPVALRDAARLIAAERRPGDLLFCADTHSLICLDHHLGDTGSVIVMGGAPLPYYVGGALIPEARRVSPDSLRRAAASGRRWWAIRTREGGHATGATATLMDSLARGGRRRIAMVTLWGGAPGMLDSTRVER